MTRDEVAEVVIGLLARYVGLEPVAISLDTVLQDELGLGSVDAAELLIALEQRTGTGFELQELSDLETVGSIVDRLMETAAPTSTSAGTLT